jgi:hypothetical protein
MHSIQRLLYISWRPEGLQEATCVHCTYHLKPPPPSVHAPRSLPCTLTPSAVCSGSMRMVDEVAVGEGHEPGLFGPLMS